MALDLLASGRHDFGGLITHHFRLEDYREAIAPVLDKRSSKVIKAVFDFD
jgi:threonine dehydrogenase-like Zn-dependent dehydrogenase